MEKSFIPSWIETTPESKSLPQSQRLLQLSDMLMSNRKMFKICLPTQNCEKLAAMGQMLRLASDSPIHVDVDKIIYKVNNLINPPEDGSVAKPGVVDSGLQVDSHDVLNLGCPGTSILEVAGNYGSPGTEATSGNLGDQAQVHLQKRAVDNVHGDSGSVMGTVNDVNVTVGVTPTSALPRDKSCDTQLLRKPVIFDPAKIVDPAIELNAAPQYTTMSTNPNPNPIKPGVPLKFQNNYIHATPDLQPSVPLLNQHIHHNATPVLLPSVPLQTTDNNQNATPPFSPPMQFPRDFCSDPQPLPKTVIFDPSKNGDPPANPDFIPSVPMHGLVYDENGTSPIRPFVHAPVDLSFNIYPANSKCPSDNNKNSVATGVGEDCNSALHYYGVVQDLIKTNKDPEIDEILCNIKSSDMCPTSAMAKERLREALDLIDQIQKRNTVAEQKSLLRDLQKHISKGGTGNTIHQKSGSCVPEGPCLSENAAANNRAQMAEGNTRTNKDGGGEQLKSTTTTRNYAEVLANRNENNIRSVTTPAKQVEIPFYPENLNKKEVRINSESLKKGAEQWVNCVVGKFIARKPPSSLIRARIMALWQKKGLISIMEQDDDFIFKFDTADQRNHILETRVWVIAGQQMIVSGWLEENAYITSHFTKFPIWVKLLKVPPICWTREGIGQIASTIGKPLVIDEVTATRQYMNYARVKIEVGAAVERPKVIQVDLDDNVSHEVLVHYTGCPPSCIECNVFGHYTSKCPKKGGGNGGKKMGVNVTVETGEGEELGDKKMGVNISMETKEDGGERKIEEASNLKRDEANEEVTSAVRRQIDDEAQTRTRQNGKQEMARSEESSSTETNANSQENQVVEKPTPEHHVKPNIKDLSKSQKKKLKKAKHGKGGGANGRSPDDGDTQPD